MPQVQFSDEDETPESRPDLERTAAPERQEPEAETPVEPAAEAVETAPAESAPAPAAETTPPKPADDKSKAAREGRAAALKALTEASNGDESEDEEPATPTKAESAPKIEDKSEPAPEASKTETDPIDRPLSKEDLADKKRTAQRFDEILADRRALRAPAKLGQSVLDTCAKASMSPEEFGGWTALGVGLKTGDPKAIEALRNVLGQYEEPKSETKNEVAQPKAGELPDWLKTKVANFEMSEETAKEIAAKFPTNPTPAPEKKSVALTPKVETPAPVLTRVDPAVQKMNQELLTLESGWQTEFKTDWPVISARAWAKVKAQGKASPEVLLERVKGAVSTVVAEMRAKAVKPPPPPRIAASTQTAAPAAKTGRAAALKNLTR